MDYLFSGFKSSTLSGEVVSIPQGYHDSRENPVYFKAGTGDPLCVIAGNEAIKHQLEV
eukprot:m.81221 g.81221  ORF g.81221 m.81221 type:complete len:58 (-) comp10986_c0_seq1:1018-1191(-)